MLTAMPRMLLSASTPPPSSTGPVWTPDAHVEVVMPVARSNLGRHAPRRFQDRESRAHGLRGIILARVGGAEDGQQAVALVLQDPSSVRLDDRGEALQHAVHDGVN